MKLIFTLLFLHTPLIRSIGLQQEKQRPAFNPGNNGGPDLLRA